MNLTPAGRSPATARAMAPLTRITFATDRTELAPGTLVYLPFAAKYAMMEDDCVECDSDWTSSQKRHIDVWMNSDGTEMASALFACEDQWTMTAATVEVSPPDGRTIATAPLFDPSTNMCRSAPQERSCRPNPRSVR